MHPLRKPRIFYAVQATGNGHISRAIQLLPYLEKIGQVDIMLSGANATLEAPLPIKYRSKGLCLFYSPCGGLHHRKMWRENSLFRAMREASQLPLEQYDAILNDFDFITAKACAIKQLQSVQWGHQASFMSSNTPRPAKKSVVGEWILQKYAPATSYVGLHFQPYDSFILPPVIKDVFRHSPVRDEGHVCVYLPAYEAHCIEHHLKALAQVHFHWFLPGISQVERVGNITYLPVSNALFNQSFLNCHGIITGGGFETPAEALFLKKRLLSIPIRGQYEQQCNAAALQQMGVMILEDADTDHFSQDIMQWLQQPMPSILQEANNISSTVEMVVSMALAKKNCTYYNSAALQFEGY